MTRTNTTPAALAFALLALAALPARPACADHVVMRDGTEHPCKILSLDDHTIRVRMTAQGITSIVNIPRADVDWIERDDIVTMEPTPPSTPPSRPSSPSHPPAAAASVTTAPTPAPPGHLFRGMLALVTGRTPDLSSPATLPPTQRGLWDDILTAEAAGKKDQLLAALTTFANADIHPASRLDALAWRHVQKPYGTWLAAFRWDAIATRYRSGQFDTRDVTAIETPALIGLLRANTPQALDPLRQYFPPPPPPPSSALPAVPHPGTAPPPSPLAGITARNALEVKDRALYASAILLAQLRLEPDMPTIDRVFLSRQLGYVRDALARALGLEPAARALKDREEQDRKLEAERAREFPPHTTPSPHP